VWRSAKSSFTSVRTSRGKPDFDCKAALAEVNDLDDDDWRVPDGGSDFAVLVNRKKRAPFRLRLLRIRSDAPFLLNSARELGPAEVETDHSFTEFTWAVIWADGIMGAVSSRDAPSHKKLGYYLQQTSEQYTHIVNLFQPNLAERLRQLRQRGMRQIDFKIRSSELEKINADERVRGVGQLFRAGRDTGAASIGIELSVGHAGAGAELSDEIGEGAEQLAEQIDHLESMHVKGIGPDGKVERINIKKERLTRPIEITGGQTNREVFEAIEQARTDLEGDIGSLDGAARGS
jgi:hypothetical protein